MPFMKLKKSIMTILKNSEIVEFGIFMSVIYKITYPKAQ
jgi:hypothetical protein